MKPGTRRDEIQTQQRWLSPRSNLVWRRSGSPEAALLRDPPTDIRHVDPRTNNPSATRSSARRPSKRRASVVVVGAALVAALAALPAAAKSKTTGSSTTASTTASSSSSLPVGSMANVVDQIGARSLWHQGVTGNGINVAVIDTGVAPVPALSGAAKVIAKVDLSAEAAVPEATYLDTYGHGTHITGIIAGHDPGADPTTADANSGQFLGVAPDAGIVAVKVGDNSGAVDVSQVIAGINWVVEHRAELAIRVLNLSYGTTTSQSYSVDPLAYAIEQAWQAGIVVVGAVGNDGKAMHTVADPALDPYVIAVGAVEWTGSTWAVPSFASSGDKHIRIPDLAAPGTHIDSLRDPGSRVDVEHPEGYVSPTIFRGSGSSQATAVVSGAAALLLSAYPNLTPDQVKALLTTTTAPISASNSIVGSGVVNVSNAFAAAPTAPLTAQTWTHSTGTGSLEATRGGEHIVRNGTPLTGEVTANGASWTGASWTGASWRGASWTGASWTGASWRGASWTGASWTGASWTGASWTGASWTGASWTGASWTGASWTGASWTGASWTGASWTGASWRGASWTGASWTGAGWQ